MNGNMDLPWLKLLTWSSCKTFTIKMLRPVSSALKRINNSYLRSKQEIKCGGQLNVVMQYTLQYSDDKLIVA